jgi:hypothetical protein
MGSRQVRLYHDHMLTKEPGTRQRTPWHQDQPYYNIEGRQNVSFWIPVDPVRRHSTLEFVAGSHQGPWLMPRSFMDHQAKWFPEGSLQDLPDIEARASSSHHRLGGGAGRRDRLPHAQPARLGGVDGDTRRRVFSVRMLGDDITHAPRPWVTSPPFPGPGLADDALFPLRLPAGAPCNGGRNPQASAITTALSSTQAAWLPARRRLGRAAPRAPWGRARPRCPAAPHGTASGCACWCAARPARRRTDR